MSEKIPEPKDYPNWLAGFLFSPENIIRHGRKTSEGVGLWARREVMQKGV